MSYEEALRNARAENVDGQAVLSALSKAHEEGDARATYALASWNLNGADFVPVNVQKGIELLRSIEDQPVAEALYDLAVAYDLGKGVRRNPRKAFELYMKSALLGHLEANRQVGQFFIAGEFVQFNRNIGRMWNRRGQLTEAEISPPQRLLLDPV